MKNLLIAVMGLAIIAATTSTVHADEHRGRREHREDRERHGEEEHEEELEILARNVRLEFLVVPLEEGDRGSHIVTATPWYTTHTKIIGEEMILNFHAAGHVRIIEDNELFVTFEVEVEYEAPGTSAEFHVDSSARLIAGKELEIATMGDKTLVIRASYADAPTSAQ